MPHSPATWREASPLPADMPSHNTCDITPMTLRRCKTPPQSWNPAKARPHRLLSHPGWSCPKTLQSDRKRSHPTQRSHLPAKKPFSPPPTPEPPPDTPPLKPSKTGSADARNKNDSPSTSPTADFLKSTLWNARPQPAKKDAPPTPARQPSKTPQSFKAILKHKNSLTLDFTNNSMENQDLFTPTGQSRLRRPAHTNSALTTGPLLPQATKPHRRSRRSRRSRPAPNKLSPHYRAAVAAGNQASPRRLIASPGCRLQLRPLDLQAKLLQKRTGFRHRTSDCPKQACTTAKAAKNLPPCLQVSDVRCALRKPTRFCIKVSARKSRGRNAVGCRGGQSLPGIHHSLTGTSAQDPGPRTPPVQTSDSYSALPVLPRPSPDYPWHPS